MEPQWHNPLQKYAKKPKVQNFRLEKVNHNEKHVDNYGNSFRKEQRYVDLRVDASYLYVHVFYIGYSVNKKRARLHTHEVWHIQDLLPIKLSGSPFICS